MKNTFLVVSCALLLSACGVKPNNVDGAEGHPRTYPDVRTDPLPHGGPGATIRR